jgi:hypothetical protein
VDKSVQHRQVKYLNNLLEADHGALKRLINPARGFKTLPTASATIKGFEVMRMIRKRQCLMLESGTTGARFANRLFRLAAWYGETVGANCAWGSPMQQSLYELLARLNHACDGHAIPAGGMETIARRAIKVFLSIVPGRTDRRSKELQLTKAGIERPHAARKGWSEAQKRFATIFGEQRTVGLRACSTRFREWSSLLRRLPTAEAGNLTWSTRWSRIAVALWTPETAMSDIAVERTTQGKAAQWMLCTTQEMNDEHPNVFGNRRDW